jgi:ribosomal protein S27AE
MNDGYVTCDAVRTDRRCPQCGWVLFEEPELNAHDPGFDVCGQCGWTSDDR